MWCLDPVPTPLTPQLSYPQLTHFFISLSLHQSRPALTTEPPSIHFLNYSRHTSVKCGCYVKQPMSSYHSQFDELWGWIIQQICYFRLFINALNCWISCLFWYITSHSSDIPLFVDMILTTMLVTAMAWQFSKAVIKSKMILQFEITTMYIDMHFDNIIFALLDTCRINIFWQNLFWCIIFQH